jgi:hypothetical protein
MTAAIVTSTRRVRVVWWLVQRELYDNSNSDINAESESGVVASTERVI